MRAVTANGSQASGVFGTPRWLAAGAAGFSAACLVAWALRGLPGGTLAFWLVALPVFAAGFGFGLGAAVVASALLVALVWLAMGFGAALVILVLVAVPVPLLLAARNRAGLGLALALLGLWPLAVLLATALFLADDGG